MVSHFIPNLVTYVLATLFWAFMAFFCWIMQRNSERTSQTRRTFELSSTKIKAKVERVNFTKQIVPDIRKVNRTRVSAECWIPEIHVSYSVGFRPFQRWLKPPLELPREFVRLDAYEEIALFGNKNQPSDTFKKQWEELTAIEIFIKSEDESIIYVPMWYQDVGVLEKIFYFAKLISLGIAIYWPLKIFLLIKAKT
jgi:hypothetical protein